MKGLAIVRATSRRGKAPLQKMNLFSAYLNEINMQAAEPCHAQSNGRATQALGATWMCTHPFCKEEAQLGSQGSNAFTGYSCFNLS